MDHRRNPLEIREGLLDQEAARPEFVFARTVARSTGNQNNFLVRGECGNRSGNEERREDKTELRESFQG